MKIYTRKGDAGTTGLVGNMRVSKDHIRIQAIGAVDELNAHLGLCRTYCEGLDLLDLIEEIQAWLFDIGAELATPREHLLYRETISLQQIEILEKSIDEQTSQLEPLKSFILPGGSILASHLHLARTVCRRAERTLLQLHHEEPIRELILAFFNRLSDWLFVAARSANSSANVDDIKWSGWKRESRDTLVVDGESL